MSNNNMDWDFWDLLPFDQKNLTDNNSEPPSPLPVRNPRPRKPPVNIRHPDKPSKATRLGGGKGKIHYYADDIMGQGATSTVYRGYFEVVTKKAAVKRLDLKFHEIYKNEIEILREVDHKNIIQYFASEGFVDSDSNLFYIAMELANFTLEDCVDKNSVNYTPSQSLLCLYLKQACKGLHWLHKNQIIHRDIKPSNILITFADNEGGRSAKLVDFGISKKFQHLKDGTDSMGRGTMDWMSPEALEAQLDEIPFNNTLAMDIFSMGLTLYFTMTSGEHPFGNKIYRAVNIMKNIFDFKHLGDNQMNIALKNLIEAMLSKEPNHRPNIGAVLEHPFFWDEKKQLEFIRDVSNSLLVDVGGGYKLIFEIDKLIKYKVAGFDWHSKMSKKIMDYILKKKKRYASDSFTKLLEFIRDKETHWPEWSEDLKVEFRGSKETYVEYFICRFPYLITFLFTYFQEPYFMSNGEKKKTVDIKNSELKMDLSKYYSCNDKRYLCN